MNNFNGYYLGSCCGGFCNSDEDGDLRNNCRVVNEVWSCYDWLGAYEGAWLVCEECIAVMKACHRHEVKS